MNSSCSLGVSRWRYALFAPTGVEETHVFFQRKLSMVEAAASSTLFPYENRISF
jgi:polyphosphate kinase 2 (PPK2 family)